ncbi:EamA family transporter, partial [Staphylococcus aureus]
NLTGALGNVTPLFAVLFAVLALGERPGAAQWLAAGVIAAGVAVLGTAGGGAAGPGRIALVALALPLAAAVVRGLVPPAVKLGLGLWPDPF